MKLNDLLREFESKPWEKLPFTNFSHTVEINQDYAGLAKILQADLPFPEKLHKAVPKRQALYLAGRYCVHQAFLQAGFDHPVHIDQTPEGVPIWPTGWVGSISHSDRMIAAVIAPRSECKVLGIDLEKIMNEKTCERIFKSISRPEERGPVNSGLTLEEYYTLVFSAKESLYKALYPEVHHFFGFEAASLSLLQPNQLELRLTQDLNEIFPSGLSLKGQYLRSHHHIFSTVYQAISAPSADGARD
ncbi:hypothetical protein COW36_08815 [bacterium (Candidatus Blackallbacteria) CG17_big_fil_post_rev_8_21_14_2_50_48_46]|uniref:4'-phosphopantetheinyl transferase n=1 Tax=bacterium (Candidatus Blackallbacteria) CG17_big_fil_post_rev_8_21_14_2_50_48_46 TaxID=2014261 RepID=A0A2M7G7B6_9BACT|nr:MAG: hypothetical protein COW64_06115 [bacterium (Candidatus Blackallbacteria) CG18_big_fil_WC_8_21_14_2_50_49_26]PIW17586.1 MAG: hypothetical protein COW36_08815 [bacterium (Candidatus Blackallbacteria) CG17_big_fil_post_rev_8_21_14_2_50_48_46]PIW48441.1 MAG: hypothetical protein COW20_10165 [bacterium (Candidatus Blackallbacteria) CG13_big_fil_rev_8_21_14_2_50_49_14]